MAKSTTGIAGPTYAGLDVSLKETAVCIVDDGRQDRVRADGVDRSRIARQLSGKHAPGLERFGIESKAGYEGFGRLLRAEGNAQHWGNGLEWLQRKSVVPAARALDTTTPIKERSHGANHDTHDTHVLPLLRRARQSNPLGDRALAGSLSQHRCSVARRGSEQEEGGSRRDGFWRPRERLSAGP